ncbi:hypothetical protein AX768_27145 [Burkholderia sp. PAMC 28687]|nr:hypothetical protein AX768_27145 [Burkholderia sp. PAMC 28687]
MMQNRTVPTVVFDHGIRAKGNSVLFGSNSTWFNMLEGSDKDNFLIPLCVNCHATKTGSEKKGFICRPDGTALPGRNSSKYDLLEFGYDNRGLPIDMRAVVRYLHTIYRAEVGWGVSTGPLLA